MVNEGLNTIDQDIARIAKDIAGPVQIDCPLLGRKISQPECATKSLSANATDFERCLSCEQGRTMAAASPFGRGPGAAATLLPNCRCMPPDAALALEPAEVTAEPEEHPGSQPAGPESGSPR